MKKLLSLILQDRFQIAVLSLALFAASFSLMPGCSTTSGGTTNTNTVATVEQTRRAERAAIVVETSAQLGTYYAIRQDRNTEAYFKAAVAVITVLIDTGNYDPSVLQDSLKNISVRELRSEEVSLAVAGAVALYANFFGEIVSTNIERMLYAKPVLLGLRNGIAKGLLSAPTERKFNLPAKDNRLVPSARPKLNP